MILEISVVILFLLFLSSCYIIWNLNTKQEILETWIEDFSSRVSQVQSDLKDIDSTGHFEADDEIGTIFEGIKEVISELNDFTEGEEISE